MKRMRNAFFVAIGLGLAQGAIAAEPGLYVGGGLGQSDFSGNIPAQISAAYAGYEPFRLDSAAIGDDSDGAWKLFAGYRFGSWLGVEFAWHDLGQAQAEYVLTEITMMTPYPPALTQAARYDLSGQSLTVFGEWDFNDSVSGILRAGVFRTELDYDEVSITGTPYSFSNSDDGDLRPTFGLGLNWRMTPSWDLRLDYDRINGVGNRFAFDVDTNGRFDHVDILSLNLAYRFGR